jgi:hypothetical protein
MKNLLILPVLLLTLLVANPASSAEYNKGMDAYKKSDPLDGFDDGRGGWH